MKEAAQASLFEIRAGAIRIDPRTRVSVNIRPEAVFMIQSPNWIFWVALLLVSGWAWCRSLVSKRPFGPLTATFVGLLSLLIVLGALRIAYVAPLAIIQDIVSAHQVLTGESLPTTEIKALIKQALAAEKRPASLESIWPRLAKLSPDLVEKEQQEYDSIATRISVQAHPPLTTMFMVPFVYLLGVHGSSLAFSLLSVGSIGVILPLLYHGLGLRLSTSEKVFFCATFLGWYPMFWVLRAGQWGALLSLLVVAGWYSIRRDYPVLAGIAIGVAATLKLFPALLLIYFLLRYRRAFWAGVTTMVIATAPTMAFFGLQSHLDYVHTTRVVTERYGHNLVNWSLMSALQKVGDLLGIPPLSSRVAFLIAALMLVAAICLLVLANRPSRSRTDLEYSLFVVAMTFLSPICWSHYFVVLLLPLAVLASRAMRESAASSLMFLVLFLMLAVPNTYAQSVLPSVVRYFGPQAGTALHLPLSLALVGVMIWLAALAWTSPGDRDELKPIQELG